jgi:hypothetical protein
MKALRFIVIAPALLVVGSLLIGCDGKKEAGHGKQEAHSEEDGHGHEHGEESPSGASFKAGKGVSLTDETRKILGLEVADVAEEKLAQTVQFTAQVYVAARNHLTSALNPPAPTLLASGLVAPAQAALVRAGMSVRFSASSGATAEGTVKEVHSSLALGDSEIDVILSETGALKSGDFALGTITLPRAEAVTVIPKSALLRTSEGSFVYAVNGTAYFRTAVKIGAESADLAEITDGLLAGDQVVIQPVQTLWLIELRAVKGGGHSH